MDLRKYKFAALLGMILIGIGSFMACLSTSTMISIVGDILLVISIAVMVYAFSTWQP